MASTIQLHEMSALTTGTDKTSGTVRFKAADNATVDTSNPLVVPSEGTTYSYTKQLRAYMEAAPASSVSNLQWYSDGANGFGTGITVNVINRGTTFATQIATEPPYSASMATLFNYTSGTPLDGDATDAGPFTPSDDDSYIGDLILLQMAISTNATNGIKSAESLTLSYDEV